MSTSSIFKHGRISAVEKYKDTNITLVLSIIFHVRSYTQNICIPNSDVAFCLLQFSIKPFGRMGAYIFSISVSRICNPYTVTEMKMSGGKWAVQYSEPIFANRHGAYINGGDIWGIGNRGCTNCSGTGKQNIIVCCHDEFSFPMVYTQSCSTFLSFLWFRTLRLS